MNNFADALFSVLLGWLRMAAAWLWNFAGQEEGGGLLVWIAEHWLPIAITLCVCGVVIDAVVYMIRWQPYKVWASFFRRLTGREDDDGEAGNTRVRRWIHADGTTSIEKVDPEEETHGEADEGFPPMPEEEVSARYAPPETAVPAQQMEAPRAEEAPVPGNRPIVRRRRYLADEGELPLRYAPPPAADGDEPAYHEPYVPAQWKRPADTGSSSGIDVGGGL